MKFPAVFLSFVFLAGCTNSPEYAAAGGQSQSQLMQEIQAMPVEDWEQPVWGQINRKTSVFLANMSDAVSNENKEALTKLVRGYFVTDMKIKRSRFLAIQNESDLRIRSESIKMHRNLIFIVASNTQDQAKQLLDRKGYSKFKKSMESFLPRVTVLRRGNGTGGNTMDTVDWRWLDSFRSMPLDDGSSRLDGRGGP